MPLIPPHWRLRSAWATYQEPVSQNHIRTRETVQRSGCALLLWMTQGQLPAPMLGGLQLHLTLVQGIQLPLVCAITCTHVI